MLGSILDFLILAILILVVILLLKHDQSVVRHLIKDRELARVREERLNKIIKCIESITQQVFTTEKLLDEKIDNISEFMEVQVSYISAQQERFKMLAESDMLMARRDELIRSKELKIALERLMRMNTMSRQSPEVIDVLAMESLTNRIEELENILNESRVV